MENELSSPRAEALRARQARAESVAARAVARLAAHGVRAVVTGSLADGRFKEHSDVDLLVLDDGGLDMAEIVCIADEDAEGLPIDVVLARTARPTVLKTMLEKARNAEPHPGH